MRLLLAAPRLSPRQRAAVEGAPECAALPGAAPRPTHGVELNQHVLGAVHNLVKVVGGCREGPVEEGAEAEERGTVRGRAGDWRQCKWCPVSHGAGGWPPAPARTMGRATASRLASFASLIRCLGRACTR